MFSWSLFESWDYLAPWDQSVDELWLRPNARFNLKPDPAARRRREHLFGTALARSSSAATTAADGPAWLDASSSANSWGAPLWLTWSDTSFLSGMEPFGFAAAPRSHALLSSPQSAQATEASSLPLPPVDFGCLCRLARCADPDCRQRLHL